MLARGEAELARLREEFVATAEEDRSVEAGAEVQASLAADHGKPETLIADVQARLAGLRKFLVDKQIVTHPVDGDADGAGDAAVHARLHAGVDGHARARTRRRRPRPSTT